MKHASRKIESRRITIDSVALYLGAARITKPKHFCDLVERFAGGVVNRSSHDPVIGYAVHVDQQGVPATNNERNIRLDYALRPAGVTAPGYNGVDERREQMTFKVIDGQIRFPKTKSEAFGE
jgi:hypothetical protein